MKLVRAPNRTSSKTPSNTLAQSPVILCVVRVRAIARRFDRQGQDGARPAIMATDRDIFLGLVDEHGAAVLALLRRLCGRGHDAEDLFQDVAVRVWRNLGSRPTIRNPRGWLMTIAYRVYLDHQARTPKLVLLLQTMRRLPARGGRDQDPAVLTERRERRGIVEDAVAELSRRRRVRSSPCTTRAGSRCERSPGRWGSPSGRSRAGSTRDWSSCGGDCHEVRPGSFVVGDRRRPRSLAGGGTSPAAPVRRGQNQLRKSREQLAEARTAHRRAASPLDGGGQRPHRRRGPGVGSTLAGRQPPRCSSPRSD